MGFMGSSKTGNSTCMELRALLQGLQLAHQYQLTPLEVNMDSTEVIMMLLNENFYYSSSLMECMYLLQQLSNPHITRIFREQIYAAHYLAKHGLTASAQDNVTVFSQPPNFLFEQLSRARIIYKCLVKSSTHTIMLDKSLR